MSHVLGLILLASCCAWVSTATTSYYVADPNGTPCPSNATCHALSFYTSQPDLFTNNTVFYFLEGTHNLTRTGHLVIAGVENVTLQGVGEMVSGFHETVTQTKVMIKCTAPVSLKGSAGLAFMNSRNITVSNITLVDCGYKAVETAQINEYFLPFIKIRSFVEPLEWHNMSFVAIEVYDLNLLFVSIQNSSGYGLVVVNGYGLSISHSSLSQNNYYTFVTPCTQWGNNCHGGNAALLYANPRATYTTPGTCPKANDYKLSITHSNFSLGVSFYDSAVDQTYSGQRDRGLPTSGLYIGMEQSLYGVDVLMDFVVAYGNTGGANIAFEVYETVHYYTLAISNTFSRLSNRIYPLPNTENALVNSSTGGGLYVVSGIAAFLIPPTCSDPQLQVSAENPITIINSSFSDNFAPIGSGMFISVYGVEVLQHVKIDSCRLSQNTGYQAMGLYIDTPYVGFGAPTNFLLKNITISGNKALNPVLSTFNTNPTIINASASAVTLLTVFNCTIQDLSITDNEGTGMRVADSGLSFLGPSNVFKNNSGLNGGGISMYGSSFFLLRPTSTIHFINNHADNFGGGLYIDQAGVLQTYCFYQMVLSYEEFYRESILAGDKKVILFSGNTADVAGSALYGGNIENCLILSNSIVLIVINTIRRQSNITNFKGSDGYFFFDQVLTGITDETGLSVISSLPVQVCFCNGTTPNCSITQTVASVYPGNSLQIPFATLGQMSGIAPGVLRAEERVKDKVVRVLLNSTAPHCSILSYPIIQDHNFNSSMLLLGINDQQAGPSTTVSVDISILACPVGFELTEEGSCNCDRYLASSIQNITCNIFTLDFTRQGDVWIGYDNLSSCLLVDDSCPFDYCNHGSVSFQIGNPDPQCALNRSGVLCGNCAQGLSLLLGSNRCGECSNAYLSLLLPFALAGFALVVLLIVLNLTVSMGTINGLIFYANIVKIGEAVFFPNGPIPVLSQFISWINLDLGIETCFYHGMNAYVKTWLQFAFPFYIWIIMIVIAVLANYSILVSKMVGHNTIAVLATLILLSYMKLFRTINLVLFARSVTCGSTDQLLWFVDANIGYFDTNHLLLGVFALIVLVFLVIPFTLILLFSPLIERCLARFGRLWKVYQLARPFFDAYGGQYEDNYRFWTGLLLLVRLVLLLVVSFSNSSSAILSAIVTTTAVVMTLAWWLKGVYRHHYLNVLESWFLFNLVFLTALAAANIAEIGVYISVSTALITFIGIVCYHVYVRVKERPCVKKITTRFMSLHDPNDYDEIAPADPDRPDVVVNESSRRPDNTTVVMQRESLLY